MGRVLWAIPDFGSGRPRKIRGRKLKNFTFIGADTKNQPKSTLQNLVIKRCSVFLCINVESKHCWVCGSPGPSNHIPVLLTKVAHFCFCLGPCSHKNAVAHVLVLLSIWGLMCLFFNRRREPPNSDPHPHHPRTD